MSKFIWKGACHVRKVSLVFKDFTSSKEPERIKLVGCCSSGRFTYRFESCSLIILSMSKTTQRKTKSCPIRWGQLNGLAQVDDSKVNSLSSKENEPENISKCSTGLLVTVEDRSQTNDHVDQLEVEYTVPDR